MEVGESSSFACKVREALGHLARESNGKLMHATALMTATRLLSERFGEEALVDRTRLVEQVRFLYTLEGSNDQARRQLASGWAYENLPAGDPSNETLDDFQQIVDIFAGDVNAMVTFIDVMMGKFHGHHE